MTARAHGVCVVQQQRVRAQLLHVKDKTFKERGGTQKPENTSRPKRIADTLIHAILERNVVIGRNALKSGDFDAVDHIVRARQHLATLGAGLHRPSLIAPRLNKNLLKQLMHGREAIFINIHQTALTAVRRADH